VTSLGASTIGRLPAWVDRLRVAMGPRRLRAIDTGARAGFVVALILFAIHRPVEAVDAHAYWAVDLANPYSRPVATIDAFTYPPPAAIGFWILGHLSWPVFQALWTLLIGAALLWLAGPWSILFLALPVVSSDLYLGNIHLLLAAAIVGGFRRPGLWAFALLTKPSCGVGLLWFLVRREWRPLALAVGISAALALVSAILQPGLWPAWIDYLLRTGVAPDVGTAAWVPIPLLVRLPVAVLLVVWGARTNRAWTVPIASMLALPVLWMVGLAMILGAVALLRRPGLAMGPQSAADKNRTPAPRTPAFDAPDRSVEVAPDQSV
jgi:hypothetical protein